VRLALDATYSVDPHPSGIAIYSRELMGGLIHTYPEDNFLFCYRPKQFRMAPPALAANVQRRLLQPPVPTFRADLFHALNQRVDRRPARRVVSTFHDLFVMTGDYSSPEFRLRFTEQARRAAQNSDWIITVSEFTADQVSSLLNFDRTRIRVIAHGVRTPPVITRQPQANTILFVGALQVRKNIARLVEAFERLPQDCRLVLAGAPTGYQAAAICQRIQESSSRDRIEIAGYVSSQELERLYSQAAVFAFPSLDEGFGIPVLEAMARGIPVLTSACSALPEVAGNAALLVNPLEVDEIESALRRLLSEPALRQELSLRGLAHAKGFPWERAIEETYATYQHVLMQA
jgi:glycosyltransferase involved in cell wall biosynthesis